MKLIEKILDEGRGNVTDEFAALLKKDLREKLLEIANELKKKLKVEVYWNLSDDDFIVRFYADRADVKAIYKIVNSAVGSSVNKQVSVSKDHRAVEFDLSSMSTIYKFLAV